MEKELVCVMIKHCFRFSEITRQDVARFGGKNASLGEMTRSLERAEVKIPTGFAIDASAFETTLRSNGVWDKIMSVLSTVDKNTLAGLEEASEICRKLVSECRFSRELQAEITSAYRAMGSPSVAVRSSATAEDLPNASFAGQHESFLNVEGETELMKAVTACYQSLYTARAIKYRMDNGFVHENVTLSVGIQRMVRSDKGSAGVAFTLDPETGFKNVIYLTGAWGLGETVVQGAVNPDEFLLFKPAVIGSSDPILRKTLGSKLQKLVYAENEKSGTALVDTPEEQRKEFVLTDTEVRVIGKWCDVIEKHYGMPMDIEWAKDGITGEIFILQARPETVHAQRKKPFISEYELKKQGDVICKGTAVGHSIVSGTVKIIRGIEDANSVKPGDILVAEITHPDWNTMLRKAICIITDKGGRTSHASIVARELGITAVVGTENATKVLKDGQVVTVCTATGEQGIVFDGKAEWTRKEIEIGHIPETHTLPMLILADPSRAFHYANYPAKGIGLLRMEFIITNSIGIHPMALAHPELIGDETVREKILKITERFADPKEFFIERLASSLSIMAAAFHPNDVIVRTSDFKTNEYADLLGGKDFEPLEENPMLGLRGASRYYRDSYKEGFGMECEAIRRTRELNGLTNLKVMIPFCRTVEEGEKVLSTMKGFGLERGKNGLEVYVMAEIPSNVLLANEFASIFDGFSIGSNDLTQLTLGIDRDAESISDLFDEGNEAVMKLLRSMIKDAKKAGRKIGLCGQAPSDKPEFAKFLVDCGIDSVSFNPDALLAGIQNIASAEQVIYSEHETITR
ncbi:MAG: phosphoenolpyruvate synthase [Bacteroidota bacterium]